VKNDWQNRVTEHAEVDPQSLVANPANFRTHPEFQKQSLVGVLNKVGWVGRILVNKTTGHIVDGHARVALAIENGEKLVPVDFVELTPEEEALVLTTFDPIGAMAETNRDALAGLLQQVQTDSDSVQALLQSISQDAGIHAPEFLPTVPGPRLDQPVPLTCPKCGHEFQG
jgi:hypothetical protein